MTIIMKPDLFRQRQDTARTSLYLSVVMPVFEEAETVPVMLPLLFNVLDGMGCTYEVIAVNDGSRDDTMDVLRKASARYSRLRVIEFTRNYGQTAAMMAGFDHARGEVIVTLDADLQNDPADIPRLVDKIREGYDVVSGWRKDRKDAAIRRNFLSRVANRLISWISGVKLNDYGCTLKAYRCHVTRSMRLYGEMHRLIPIYASWYGAKVVEIPVGHQARQFGHSKYGMTRIMKVLLDLTVVMFLEKFLAKPIYLFGGFAFASFATSFGVIGWAIALKVLYGTSLIHTPLPLLSAMLFLIGCMSMLLGLLAEIITRTYFESQSMRAYVIRERLNEPVAGCAE
jgi:glycosyltransferase involved in cell wall biosynthesis